MEDRILPLLGELALLAACGGVYYLWQRHRILYGPRGWRESCLGEMKAVLTVTGGPEDFSRDIENLESLTDAFLEKWHGRDLPPELAVLVDECHEWAVQSQPKT